MKCHVVSLSLDDVRLQLEIGIIEDEIDVEWISGFVP